MTQVRFSVRKPKTGGTDPVKGSLGFQPVRRYFDSDKNLILPYPFTATLDDDGTATVDLAPTSSEFVWQVTVNPSDNQKLAWTRWVEVPAPESGDNPPAVEFADLVDVDPATMAPAALSGGVVKALVVGSEAEAQEQSKLHPGWIVFYGESGSQTRAMEILESMTSLAAKARESAVTVSSVKANVLAEAQTISSLHKTVDSAGDAVTARSLEVQSNADDAVKSINDAVKQVTDRATQAQDSIGQAESSTPAAKPESTPGTKPGDAGKTPEVKG